MHKTLLATLISGLLFASSLYAEETESDANIEVISIKGSRLDKAATATGLPLTLRDTPQSVTIIDQEFIQSFSLNNVADLMFLTPGISAQKIETNRYFLVPAVILSLTFNLMACQLTTQVSLMMLRPIPLSSIALKWCGAQRDY